MLTDVHIEQSAGPSIFVGFYESVSNVQFTIPYAYFGVAAVGDECELSFMASLFEQKCPLYHVTLPFDFSSLQGDPRLPLF